ncbi:MAG: SPOR domain-containing protein [Nitrospinota bacterium]
MKETQKGGPGGLALTKNQYILLLLGILLISVLSFVLGFLASSGKNKPDSRTAGTGGTGSYQSGGPALQTSEKSLPVSASANPAVASVESKSDLVKESELTFFKSLSEIPKPSAREAPQEKQKKPVEQKKNDEEKKPPKTKKKQVASTPNTDILNMFTVQVASFKKREDAFSLQKKLERKGYESYTMILNKNDSKWFRVRVGALRTKEEARALLGKLESHENLKAYIATYTR